MAIIIIIIILYFLNNNNVIFGGNTREDIEQFKNSFDPIFRYKNHITDKFETYVYRSDRYTTKNQIMQVAKLGNKNEVARLTQLLSKFINVPVRNICGYLYKTDKEIKDIVVKNSKKLKKDNKATNEINIEKELNNNIKLYKMSTKVYIAKSWSIYKNINNYLDFGCNNGYNTRCFGKVLGAKNIYGCDIGKFAIPEIIFDTVIDGKPLPYPDNHFEVISIVHVLHHVTDINYLLKEFRRILKPYGIIVLMDHIIWNDMDCMLVDIEHWLWNTVNTGAEGKVSDEEGEFTVKHYINYVNIGKMFANERFICIQAASMFYNFNKEPQPTKTFWSIFVKIEDKVDFQGYATTYLYGNIKKYEALIGHNPDNKI